MVSKGHRGLPWHPLRQLLLQLERWTHVQCLTAQIQVHPSAQRQDRQTPHATLSRHNQVIILPMLLRNTRILTELSIHNSFLFIVIFRPDLIDMELVARQSNRDNLEQAFEIAESLGVTRLLDAEGDVQFVSSDIFLVFF